MDVTVKKTPGGSLMSEAVMRLEEYDTDTRHQATVVSSERITPEDDDE